MAAIIQWRHVPAVQDGAVDLKHGLPGEPGQLPEKLAVESEEDPQALGDRQDKLAVCDGGAQVAGDVLGHDQRPLLVTARAEAASAAGEGDEKLVAAPRTPYTGEAFTEVAAGEELLDGGCDDGPPEAVMLPVALVVDALELVEVSIEQFPER